MPTTRQPGYAQLADADDERNDEIAELQRLVRTLEQEVGPEPEPESSMAVQLGELQRQVAELTPRPAEALGRDSVSREEHQAALEKHQAEHQAALKENAKLRQVVSSVRAVADDEERLWRFVWKLVVEV